MDYTSDHDTQIHIAMIFVWKVLTFPTLIHQFKSSFPKLLFKFTGYKNKLLLAKLNISDGSFWVSSQKKKKKDENTLLFFVT